jgi:hypothetical protein
MKAKYKVIILATCLALVLIPILLVVYRPDARILLYRLRQADHKQILLACREAITNRLSYRNDNAQWGTVDKNTVVILPPMPENLPFAIRDLHPKDVLIYTNSVMINLSLPLYRLELIGYEPNAQQAGTSRYIDGLWLITGYITTNIDGK